MRELSHFDENNNAIMVDVSGKQATSRSAVAKSSITLATDAYEQVKEGTNKKGDVLGTARLAGIMASKQTSSLIPLCHPLPLQKAAVDFEWEEGEFRHTLHISAFVKTSGQTGVEMEALTAASVTALTVYDMCKAADKYMVIGPTFLEEKIGGSSGYFKRDAE
ncbi:MULTISPECIES: cyclic pyranopterin monophosphate synthase MoaC [Salimicrobium]|uniref:Cyclic pyranopterin monophosphate synthase n=2 Tax=Salimicrobium TaxID=351195 RepID=A0ABY1KX41_9BACI|nr:MULTISPECIES: cyclic pyranopterin monophosphate synthase MoaC [Salimicrobium]SDX86963.1 cyclic pyranopterin monophosphate synthase subunit MoaC [Salimicrobium album]SIS88484.1 cyclic pyranopterin monophosphate synthase subunit MoaC [Salimicrobium salexigens]